MLIPIVDCHSHVFNAEDLPIDGFVKKLSPAPSILTGIISVPLDRLTQWVAISGHREAEYLASLLVPRGALEAGGAVPPPQRGSDLVSDAEIDELFLLEWTRRGLVNEGIVVSGGLEAGQDPDGVLVDGIGSPQAHRDRAELDAWLRTLGDHELEEALALEALEGGSNWYERIKATKRAVMRYVEALRLITQDRHLVAAELANTYPAVSLFVPALVDFEYTSNDAPSSHVTEQVRVHSLLSKVSVVGKIPRAPNARFHPLVGYCPYREVESTELRDWAPSRGLPNNYVPFADTQRHSAEDVYHPEIRYNPDRARSLNVPLGPWETHHVTLKGVTRSIDVVRYAIELGGFVGVKIYPPAGYLPLGNVLKFGGDRGERLDAALRAIYAYCVGMDVPILAHANHSNGFQDGYSDLAGPDGWKMVLEEFPELRVCFGHFGHMHGVGTRADRPAVDSWVRKFVDLIDSSAHVYADVGNSKFPVQESYRNRYVELLGSLLGVGEPSQVQYKRRRRVMFGTDFWMNTLAPQHREYLSVFEANYRPTFGDEASEMFFGGNALRWIGIQDDSGRADLTNANRSRLLAFYGEHAVPDWLAVH